ncbi:MAG TPA: adenylate/guanylate cyclase domain-containing protein [Gaiellaceae bacterium]|nr:adenylate/guanylate cyclase domain-containing protein [Gaiellaceae bacterium]
MAEVAERLEQARAAAASGAWPQAYALLSECGPDLTDAEELELLGESAWWTGRVDESVDARTRAVTAWLERGEEPRAGVLSLKIGRELEHKRSPLAKAWYSRAERLLAERSDTPEYGYLVRKRAREAIARGAYEEALRHAEETLEIGTRHRDRDLMALGLHDKGTILVRQGQVEEGMSLLDEATVAAVSGELGPYNTAVVYCGIIAACRDLGDIARAGDWTEAAKRWCERQSISGFPGVCRVNRAEIMRLRGSWPEAEEEIRRAVDELHDFAPDIAGVAFYELGELQLRMGDLAAAEQAFRDAHALGTDPHPGLALLRLARGEVDAARRGMQRALDATSDPLRRARLLPGQLEVALATQDADGARAVAAELDRTARQYGTATLEAWAALAAGEVGLAEGDLETAHADLERAIGLFHEVEAPYEAARARMHQAEAYRRGGDAAAAELELAAAQATFERLGAARDARSAAEALARVDGGSGTRTGRTFLFTDISDSTPLVEAIGDEAWQNLIGWHDRTLRALFAEHGGEEVEHPGDGFFVAFPDAQSAADCAVAVQRSLAEHRRTHGFAPQLRAGIHAAEAQQSGGSYWGKGVHEAARIGGLAAGGEIVASRATAEQLTGVASSEPRVVELKGIAEPVEVVTLSWR